MTHKGVSTIKYPHCKWLGTTYRLVLVKAGIIIPGLFQFDSVPALHEVPRHVPCGRALQHHAQVVPGHARGRVPVDQIWHQHNTVQKQYSQTKKYWNICLECDYTIISKTSIVPFIDSFRTRLLCFVHSFISNTSIEWFIHLFRIRLLYCSYIHLDHGNCIIFIHFHTQVLL